MTLELYERYWETASSSPKQERERLSNRGRGNAIGAQNPMVQNQFFGYLKQLYDEAGLDDWISRVDHTLSYDEQKNQIIERYNVEGFKIDQEEEQCRLEAQREKWEEQAPDGVPETQEERMRERAREEPSTDDRKVTEQDLSSTDGTEESDVQEDDIQSDWESLVVSPSSESSDENQGSQDNSQGSPLTLDEAQGRCLETIEEAYQADEPILIDALPGLGKSHGAIKAAANTDTPITILTTRGREEQYQKIQEWCDDVGLSHRVLPSVQDDCPTFAGNHGSDWESRVNSAYELSITPSDLHHYLDLPCQENGNCPYEAKWDFNPDQIDVIIGHYLHAYVEKIIEERVVVIDEFPGDTYITTIEDRAMVSNYLQENDQLPFNDIVGLLTKRSKEVPREEALEWFEDRGFDLRQSESLLLEEVDDYHALAPTAVLAVLEANDLGNSWEHATLGRGEIAAHNRQSMEIVLLRPPDLSKANGIVGLDGTPTPRLWELVYNLDFKREQVLADHEREEYIRDLQQLNIIQTALDTVLPYSSGRYADLERDAALITEAANQHSVQPAVITSKVVLEDIEQMGLRISNASTYYGNIRGSNELADEDIGVILGSPHNGDPYIEKWAALFGISAEGKGKGLEREYGPLGNEVLSHMRENEVLQSVFRFTREGSGATVYVNTAAIPGWVPRELALGVMRKRTDAEQRVIDALADMGTASGTDLASRTGDHENTVRSHLGQLSDEGMVRKTGQKSGTQWHDNGLANINRYGQVDLTSITKDPYKIPIRDLGEKMEHQMEQFALGQRRRERLLEHAQMERWRSS